MAACRMELLKDENWSRRMAAQAVTKAANGLAYVTLLLCAFTRPSHHPQQCIAGS